MKNLIIQVVSDVVQNPKSTVAVAAITTANGVLTAKQWIEINIGITSSVIGIISVVIMTYIQYKKNQREKEKHQRQIEESDLRIRILRKQLREDE